MFRRCAASRCGRLAGLLSRTTICRCPTPRRGTVGTTRGQASRSAAAPLGDTTMQAGHQMQQGDTAQSGAVAGRPAASAASGVAQDTWHKIRDVMQFVLGATAHAARIMESTSRILKSLAVLGIVGCIALCLWYLASLRAAMEDFAVFCNLPSQRARDATANIQARYKTWKAAREELMTGRDAAADGASPAPPEGGGSARDAATAKAAAVMDRIKSIDTAAMKDKLQDSREAAKDAAGVVATLRSSVDGMPVVTVESAVEKATELKNAAKAQLLARVAAAKKDS